MAKERPETKIVVCEPEIAAMLTDGTAQERNPDGSPAASHPAFTPHSLQGFTPDFIPKLTGDAVDAGAIDQLLTIAAPDAMRCSQDLARKEGIFVGITSGATLAAALQVCEQAPEGSTILCMLPDTGERYLSTRCSPISGRDDRGRGGYLALDAELPLGAGSLSRTLEIRERRLR